MGSDPKNDFAQNRSIFIDFHCKLATAGDGGENARRERRGRLQVEAAECAARRPSEAAAGRGGQARGRAGGARRGGEEIGGPGRGAGRRREAGRREGDKGGHGGGATPRDGAGEQTPRGAGKGLRAGSSTNPLCEWKEPSF